jgi:aspartyl/asparaginyl-tRNA synthetase
MDNLLKISFVVAILGLICLLLFVKLSDVKAVDISKLDQSQSDVKITGEVTKIRSSEKVSTVTIQQSCNIDVVVFDNISKSKIQKGDTITVTGTKQNNNGIYQIYADEISVKN